MAKVLAVDDSESIRRMVELTLEDENHDVTLAEDGTVALSYVKSDRFDLVITDINMPTMGGFELIRHLRALPTYKLIPILCLTTESSSDQKEKGRAAGATGWIVKPFSAEKLINIINRVL